MKRKEFTHLKGAQKWLINVSDSMGKRKAEFDTSAGLVVEASGVEVSWPEATTNSVRETTTVGTVGQVALEGVPTTHVGLGSATVVEREGHEGHEGSVGVPTSHSELIPTTVDEGGDTTANPFWELLRVARYELWRGHVLATLLSIRTLV